MVKELTGTPWRNKLFPNDPDTPDTAPWNRIQKHRAAAADPWKDPPKLDKGTWIVRDIQENQRKWNWDRRELQKKEVNTVL